jgi:hypothetical protein
MTIKHFIIAILAIFLAGFLYNAVSKKPQEVMNLVTSFTACRDQGYTIMESYPARCITPDGLSFTEDIGNELEKTDLIVIDAPRPNTSIASPLSITGQARGYWFFEASFPITLLDANGNVLVESFATAEGEWMTEEFVPFATTLTFPQPMTSTGTLILKKDNPSGDPIRDDSLIVPVLFSQ